jgi:dihydrofolate reductase
MTDATNDRSTAANAGRRALVAFLLSTLDGFIATSEGVLWERFVWGQAEMEWKNEQFRRADTWVLERTMYETIIPWWSAVAAGAAPEDAGELSAADHDFAQMLSRMTKVVVSTTLAPNEN